VIHREKECQSEFSVFRTCQNVSGGAVIWLHAHLWQACLVLPKASSGDLGYKVKLPDSLQILYERSVTNFFEHIFLGWNADVFSCELEDLGPLIPGPAQNQYWGCGPPQLEMGKCASCKLLCSLEWAASMLAHLVSANLNTVWKWTQFHMWTSCAARVYNLFTLCTLSITLWTHTFIYCLYTKNFQIENNSLTHSSRKFFFQ